MGHGRAHGADGIPGDSAALVRPQRRTYLDASATQPVNATPASSQRRLPTQPERPRRRAAAALAFVSAGLASGGTFGLLAAGGYLSRGAGAPASPVITSVKFPPAQQNVTVEQSDLTRSAAAVSPAVVTVTSSAASTDDPLATSTGVGSGVIYGYDAPIGKAGSSPIATSCAAPAA